MSQRQRIGLLEIIQYVLAVVLVFAAVAWNQYLVPVLVACVIAIPYAIWRRLQHIEWEDKSRQHAPQAVSKTGSSFQWHGLKRSMLSETTTNGKQWNLYPDGMPVVATLEREKVRR